MADTLAWPVRIENGDYAVVEVGSAAEARQNVAVLSQTRIGDRLIPANYGIEDPVGRRGYDPQDLIDATRDWVPGVTVNGDRLPADRREHESIVEVTR